MSDKFFFSALDGWFSGYFFKDFQLLGYIGDRDRLSRFQEEKSFWRRVTEIVAPRVKISSLIKLVSGFDLSTIVGGKTNEPSVVATQIINLLNERKHKEQLSSFVANVYKKNRSKRRYFDSVSQQFNRKSAVYDADMNSLSGNLIVVEGHLIHRTTVAQYAKDVADSLNASSGQWVLGDFPPHGMVKENDRFTGPLLLLEEDAGFTRAFGEYLPFCTAIGWYPYCRIVGFFNSTRMQTEVYPSLSVSLVEYRRPKLFREAEPDLYSFLRNETEHPIYLRDWADNVLAGYLLPFLRWGSNLRTFDAEEEQGRIIERWYKSVQNLPASLKNWYSVVDAPGIQPGSLH